jgi:predicted RNase H-like nuclease (RuvC/YqgF family)
MKKLVLGVDPGVTCGVAALTLEGTPIYVGSRRDWKLSDLLKMLTNLGEPVLVSSDVSPAPGLVKKISANLNASVFTPLISLGTVEKQHLARSYAEGYDIKLSNTHEIDALAAALKAYNHFRSKFEQIEMHTEIADSKVSIDEVKELLVKGYSINRAIDYLQARPREKTPPPILTKRIPTERRIKDMLKVLKSRLILEKKERKRLAAENRELNRQIRSLKKEISGLQEKIDEIGGEQLIEIRKEREVHRLQVEVQSLKRRLRRSSGKLSEYKERLNALQRLRELESKGELILLKPIERFTAEGLERASKLYEIKPGDYVLLLDATGGGATTARKLAEKGVRSLVLKTSMSHQARDEFAAYDIPLISAEKVKIEWIAGFPYVKSSSLNDAFERLQTKEVREVTTEVQHIIEEHREELKKGT